MTMIGLESALEEVATAGHCLVRDALTTARTDELLAEVACGQYSPLDPQIGTVRQRGDGLTIGVGDEAFPLVARLVTELTGEVTASRVDGTADYEPNEITCQRYLDDSSGIAAHMDQRRYRLLVAVFTLVGEATFRVFENRSATKVVGAWTTRGGDLCLLRAPGLAGHSDGRPTHSVAGPTASARVSLTVRMNQSIL
jgi:hypothetical protein